MYGEIFDKIDQVAHDLFQYSGFDLNFDLDLSGSKGHQIIFYSSFPLVNIW